MYTLRLSAQETKYHPHFSWGGPIEHSHIILRDAGQYFLEYLRIVIAPK